MSDLREAAQQALEALEGGADSWRLVGPAIDALKAALAEQPVPPTKAVTDAEKLAYAAGWWKALEVARKRAEDPDGTERYDERITALKAALAEPNADYERGFIDGMSEQAKRSVDKAVNAMHEFKHAPYGFYKKDGELHLGVLPLEGESK